MKTGIVSVTFRGKSIFDIIAMAKQAGLDAIEIGSDVHAPYDADNLADIAKSAADNGIDIVSYGTYYKLGQYPDAAAEFMSYIKAAKLLGTKNLRLWAGVKNSEDVDSTERRRLTDEAILCADLAAKENMAISFEYHGGTLTNNADSALRLMHDIARANASLYWQPNQYKDLDFNIAALKSVLEFVSNVHVFAWDARSGSLIRYPLADFDKAWHSYLNILAPDKRDHALLLEFVKDDSDKHFFEDAKTLNDWRDEYAL